MLPSPPKPLLFGAALATPHPRRRAALALANFNDAMLITNRPALSRLPAVHSAMLNWVDLLKVIRPAASMNMASVVDMPPGRAVQRLVNKPMNDPELTADPHMAVSSRISGACPNPTVACVSEVGVETQESFVREHVGSIHIAGFNASEAAHD
jgi:hypothetical protein